MPDLRRTDERRLKMTKTITDYTREELLKKINAIKAERERTANALKRYEEELERRKQEVPLGVPAEGNFCVNFNNTVCDFNNKHRLEEMEYNIFNTFESAKKHSEMLSAWRKDGLVANSKGEPIDIKVLLPLLKKGKVLYSPYDEKWKWLEQEAIAFAEEHGWYIKNSQVLPIEGFNIKPADDWKTSLMECGL